MGTVNVCVKRSYITVAALIGILSGLLLAVTLFSHGYFHEKEEMQTGLHAMYGISTVTLLLTIIGVFGACKKKKWALILFAVGMILTSLLLFVSGINGLVHKPQVAKELKEHYLDMGPLTNASDSFKDHLDESQMELQCCGLDQGYVDWGHDIPESCICSEESTNPCVAAPRHFGHRNNDQPVMIYKDACLPYLIAEDINAITIGLGLILGVALLWVLSVVLCIFILCRMHRKEDIPVVVYSPQAKAGNYTNLAEPGDFS